jgi:hypothetical protein
MQSGLSDMIPKISDHDSRQISIQIKNKCFSWGIKNEDGQKKKSKGGNSDKIEAAESIVEEADDNTMQLD